MLNQNYFPDFLSQQLPRVLLLLRVRDEWVFWGEDNIFGLPCDHRPYRWAIKNDILALGYKSGRVTFIGFDPNHMPVGKTA